MQTRHTKLGPLLVLVLAAAPCCATDHIVNVGNGGARFDPNDLTIQVHDTVTFKQTGAPAGHNVHADDDSFRCSVGCRGDGSGATGNPADQDWSDTLSFNAPGVISYKCDPHANMGMTGRITVNVVDTGGQNIVGGISGNWFDPTTNQGGHGFQLEVLPGNGMLAIWFVFNPAGTAQNWIFSQGPYDPASNTVALPAFLQQGGAFPPNFDSRNLTTPTPAWGTLQFTFTDCNNGTFNWKSNAASAALGYGDVSFPIQRLTSIAGTSCP